MIDFTDDDLAEIGRGVLSGIAAMTFFGWSSPDGILEYVERPDDWRRAVVYDLMCSARIGDHGLPARAELARFVESTNLLDAIAAAMV